MKKLFFIFSSVLLFSCGNKEDSSSQDDQYLEQKKMVEILVDLNLSEANLGGYYLPGDTIRRGAREYYDSLFSRHAVSKEEFLKNLHHYTFDTEKMVLILEDVVDSLRVLNTELEKN